MCENIVTGESLVQICDQGYSKQLGWQLQELQLMYVSDPKPSTSPVFDRFQYTYFQTIITGGVEG